MAWLPRTLFQRNLLLIVALILVGQLGSAWLFRTLVTLPRTTLLMESTVRELQAIESGLATLPAEQRRLFVERFNAQVQQAVDRSEGPAQELHSWRATRLQRVFLDQLAERWAQTGRTLQWRHPGGRLVQVRLAIDDQPHWVTLPGLPPAPVVSTAWIAASLATALLAIIGAWAIQRRINRPLNALVRASAALGRGERPEPLPVDTPREIASVSQAFNDMVASLAQSERERALMLAGLSHDLRTPLAKMRLATEMLDGRAEAELLATVNRNIEAMDGLLSRFLDFMRTNQGEREPLVEADLNVLVHEALALCPHNDVQLRLSPLPLRAMRPQGVVRLVLNLVVNAQRHGAPPIEVATGEQHGVLWLEVRDRGPGIEAARVEALKQPFARGDQARGGPAGAGLGLAIADRVAKAHGARFDLLPREGGGLVARVTLPA
jgi:two-component system osmolarity sensor histidine kinase EnvZ